MPGERRKKDPITSLQRKNRQTGETGGEKTPEKTNRDHSIPIVYRPEQQRLSPTRIKTQLGRGL